MYKRFFWIASVVIFLIGLYFISPPLGAVLPNSFTVSENESLRSISVRLEEERIIRSALLFRTLISFFALDRTIELGIYRFTSASTIFGVVHQFREGPQSPLLSVTIPEGSTTEEVAVLVDRVLPSISQAVFVEYVRKNKLDGYLFPSTYQLLPSYDEEKIIQKMVETFEKEYTKIAEANILPNYVNEKRKVVSLAAILEGEANKEEDMRMISGILQARLKKGMRLQVDVVPSTYRQAGIPEIPHNNPGTISISAVFNPIPSAYLYYITGNDGKMYYAKTFEEHKKNINQYLR